MSLESGTYTIRNKINNNPVGRFIVEDRSLLPKRVLSLPQDNRSELPVWKIEKSKSDSYRLKARGGVTTAIDNMLFALLLEEEGLLSPSEWRLVPHPEHGPDVYNIVTPDTGYGWTVTGEDMAQIEVVPILPNAPTSLFEVVPLEHE
ncbi:hypothetical protein TWF694_007809 [Orbilia ellipsospora]|uniref:Uncharacterized protein n=1 Tax=Orbilia ellipsospora TaxID=2528407 RepID=A0AAV9XJA8_9PEZI